MEVKEKVVDIKSVLKESKSGFYRNLPNFIVNWIRKVVREDDLNKHHLKNKELEGIEYVKAVLFDEFKVKLNIVGQENIDKNKKYVYVANHPLGAIDALSFLVLVHNIHGNVVSPSNQLFEYIPNLHSLIVGINVFGQNTKEKAKQINEAFESGVPIMIFPAGEVSRKRAGKIIDPQWQKTFVTKALQYKRDIVPVHITGQNSKKFYRTANIRKFFGIKMYIETMLLPQEIFKQIGSELTLTIGKPFSHEEIKTSKIPHIDWAEKIKKYVYSLPERNII